MFGSDLGSQSVYTSFHGLAGERSVKLNWKGSLYCIKWSIIDFVVHLNEAKFIMLKKGKQTAQAGR